MNKITNYVLVLDSSFNNSFEFISKINDKKSLDSKIFVFKSLTDTLTKVQLEWCDKNKIRVKDAFDSLSLTLNSAIKDFGTDNTVFCSDVKSLAKLNSSIKFNETQEDIAFSPEIVNAIFIKKEALNKVQFDSSLNNFWLYIDAFLNLQKINCTHKLIKINSEAEVYENTNIGLESFKKLWTLNFMANIPMDSTPDSWVYTNISNGEITKLSNVTKVQKAAIITGEKSSDIYNNQTKQI